MEALNRNFAIHSIAQFVEDTNVRLSYLRLLHLSEKGKIRVNTQADGLLSDATTAVNGLFEHFSYPVSVWHRSPQLNAIVRLTLHQWQGFSPQDPDKVILHATCLNPVERTTQKGTYGVDTMLFSQLLRVQHPLEPFAPVYYSHEPTETLLDINSVATLDLRRSGAIPSWRS